MVTCQRVLELKWVVSSDKRAASDHLRISCAVCFAVLLASFLCFWFLVTFTVTIDGSSGGIDVRVGGHGSSALPPSASYG